MTERANRGNLRAAVALIVRDLLTAMRICVWVALLAVGAWAVAPAESWAAGIGKITAVINQLHGASLSGASPADNQVMTFDSSAGTWGPEAAASAAAINVDEITLDVSNDDTFINRDSAGVVGFGATTGNSDGETVAAAYHLGGVAVGDVRLEKHSTDTNAMDVRLGDDSGQAELYALVLRSATVDAAAAGALTVGAGTATSVDVSATTEVTTVKGLLNVDEATTLDTTLGVAGLTTLTGGSSHPDDVRALVGTGDDYFTQGETTTLGAETATTVFSVVTANGDMAAIHVVYCLRADDSTEFQSEGGTLIIAITDDAGGVVVSTPIETSGQALSSGTLTSVWTVVTTDDQSIEIQLASVSSLTQTTHEISWFATCSGNVTLVVP